MLWEGNRAPIEKEETSYPEGEAPLKVQFFNDWPAD